MYEYIENYSNKPLNLEYHHIFLITNQKNIGDFNLKFNGQYSIAVEHHYLECEHHCYGNNACISSFTEEDPPFYPEQDGNWVFYLSPWLRTNGGTYLAKIYLYHYEDCICLRVSIEDRNIMGHIIYHYVTYIIETSEIIVGKCDYVYRWRPLSIDSSLQARCMNYIVDNQLPNINLLPVALQRPIFALQFKKFLPNYFDEIRRNICKCCKHHLEGFCCDSSCDEA